MPTTTARKPRVNGATIARLLEESWDERGDRMVRRAVLVDNGGTVEVWPYLPADSATDPEVIVLADADEAVELLEREEADAALEVGRKLSRAQVLARAGGALEARLLEELEVLSRVPSPRLPFAAEENR